MSSLTTETLNALLLEAFSGKTTWLEASTRYTVDEFMEAFYATRAQTLEMLADLTDAQVAFTSPAHPMWSISESISHLIYSQNFYYNKLLEMSTAQLPHILEAARGKGEGAQTNLPAEKLREDLHKATERIRNALTATRHTHDPNRSEKNSLFGVCAYQTWVLLLLGHEVDHIRQVKAMRRVAKAEGR